jgi:hypothetical protein
MAPSDNPARAIYGLLAVGALLAAESGSHETYAKTIGSAIVGACLYWLLHSYATALGLRLGAGERLTPRSLMRALAYERPLLRGAAVPVGALLVAWVAGAPEESAVTIALWSAIVSLFVFELVAGLRARASPSELALDAFVGLALGVAVLGLRIILH